MTELSDEPLEKVADTKDMVEAMDFHEKVYGTVQCNNCKFWGRMDGIIEANDKQMIKFVCPKCGGLEKVKNPEAMK